MLNQRKSLLQYLRRKDFDSYAIVLSRLGLRDNYMKLVSFSQSFVHSLLMFGLTGKPETNTVLPFQTATRPARCIGVHAS